MLFCSGEFLRLIFHNGLASEVKELKLQAANYDTVVVKNPEQMK
jgi:hypothetical protein